MGIIVGKKHGDSSSHLGRRFLHFTLYILRMYKKITSYPLDGCVPGYVEAEGRGRRQDGMDLSTGLGHGQMRQKRLGYPRGETRLKTAW